MKVRCALIAAFVGAWFAAAPATAASATSPRAQLKEAIAQLQKSPGDTALRETIIALAKKIKPTPERPEEADRRMARGTAAFKDAKSAADYGDAAKEFELAALAAPWDADVYYNLGLAQDKAGDYAAAVRSLELASLGSQDAKAVKALMYEVEYRRDKAAAGGSAKADSSLEGGVWEASAETASVNGGPFSPVSHPGANPPTSYVEIHGGQAAEYVVYRNPYERAQGFPPVAFSGKQFERPADWRSANHFSRYSLTISEDGKTITRETETALPSGDRYSGRTVFTRIR